MFFFMNLIVIGSTPTKLAKSVDGGVTWIDLLSDVYEFGIEGIFMFASIMVGIVSMNEYTVM